MRDETIITIVAMTLLTAFSAYVIHAGVNDKIASVCIIALAGLGGFKLRDVLEKRKVEQTREKKTN